MVVNLSATAIPIYHTLQCHVLEVDAKFHVEITMV